MGSSPVRLYKIVYTVPPSYLAATKDAIFATGAGRYFSSSDAVDASSQIQSSKTQVPKPQEPLYQNVALETPSVGVFTPGPASNPNIGEPGTEERVEEIRVEIRCAPGADGAREAVKALLKAHPYEVVGYEVYKIQNF